MPTPTPDDPYARPVSTTESPIAVTGPEDTIPSVLRRCSSGLIDLLFFFPGIALIGLGLVPAWLTYCLRDSLSADQCLTAGAASLSLILIIQWVILVQDSQSIGQKATDLAITQATPLSQRLEAPPARWPKLLIRSIILAVSIGTLFSVSLQGYQERITWQTAGILLLLAEMISFLLPGHTTVHDFISRTQVVRVIEDAALSTGSPHPKHSHHPLD